MWLLIVILWAPWAALVTWLAREVLRGKRVNADASADELARRAYARGEITRERFMEMLADLGSGAGSGGRSGDVV
ncbi:MAG: SHOCT domain-containing protein [Dehalococcoidia bacterium]|nr:SHOCT domain-containing protein [Dehalococcoidia bacterium]